MSTLFIQITPETSLYCVASNLTKMQYRLWLFLYHLDPFGDRPVLIPTPVELATQLNMSVRSIYRALQKLSELGLFKIASNYSRSITNGIKNQPLGTKKLRSRNFKGCAKNVTVVPEMSSTLPKLSQPCQNWQNQPPEPNQDKGFAHPQTNTDNIQTLSDIEGSKNINSMANSQELVDYWFEENTCNSSSIAVKDPGGESIACQIEQLDENDNSEITIAQISDCTVAESIAPVSHQSGTAMVTLAAVTNWNWLPSGPWSIEGKLDPNFRDWLANEWIKEYGGTIAQKRANVLAYFHSKPAMLPVRWEQYRSEYLDRFTNAQTRMTNGMSIDPTEQQQLIDHTAAVTNPLPPAMSPVAEKSVRSESGVKSQESGVKVTKLVQENNNLLESEVKSQERSPEGVNSTELIPQNNINDINNQLIPTSPTNGNNSQAEKLLTSDSRLLTPRESVIDFSALDRDEEIPENPDAYKLLRPEKINNPASPKQLRDMFATIAERLKMKPPKSAGIKPENNLAKLNSWLADPILYPEAVQRAKNNGYSIDFNENGRAIAIYELDF